MSITNQEKTNSSKAEHKSISTKELSLNNDEAATKKQPQIFSVGLSEINERSQSAQDYNFRTTIMRNVYPAATVTSMDKSLYATLTKTTPAFSVLSEKRKTQNYKQK